MADLPTIIKYSIAIFIALSIISALSLIAITGGMLLFGYENIDRFEDALNSFEQEPGADQRTISICEEQDFNVYVADTQHEQSIGLSETENLAEDEGMLFEFNNESERIITMRDMDFGLDIMFIGANGSVTGLYSAPAPNTSESGVEQHHTYRGSAKWVLEVNKGAISSCIEEGQTVDVGTYEPE